MKKTLIFFLLITAVFLSCQKSDTNSKIVLPPSTPTVDGVIKCISFSSIAGFANNNTTTDSITYTSAGRLNYVYRTNDTTRGRFVYSGADIVRVNWTFQPFVYHDSVYYANGLIDSVVRFLDNGQRSIIYGNSFTGSLLTQKQVSVVDFNTNKLYNTIYYTYDSVENLVSIQEADVNGVITHTYNYFYSKNENKLQRNIAFHVTRDVLMWPRTIDVFSYSPQMPDSIVVIDKNGTQSYSITYDMSANGYPINIYSNGNKFFTFGY